MITYLKGDATLPVCLPALIIHVCNDVGGWGRGFVKALSKRTTAPERAFRRAPTRDLGNVEFVLCTLPGVNEGVAANMVAQHDIHPAPDGTPPIRYDALEACLYQVAAWCALHPEHTIHAPRFGCGLAGGTWERVEPLIQKCLPDTQVYIYDLP